MTISVGDKLPDATLMRMGAEGPETVALSSLTKSRKIVLTGLPGAYTGTCSTAHIPSYIRTHDAIIAKGVDEIICVTVNDPFVVSAWSDATGAGAGGVVILGDPEATFIKAIGLNFSAPPVGLIDRSLRFSMVVDDGTVTLLNVEEDAGKCVLSAGEEILDAL